MMYFAIDIFSVYGAFTRGLKMAHSNILEKFPPAPRSIWSGVPDEKWNDWKWQLQNKIKRIEELEKAITVTEEEKDAFLKTDSIFHMGITPYYASLMDGKDTNCPIRLQAVPHPSELLRYEDELEDPLGEEKDMPVPGITHRYPDRVLFYITPNCPVFCRHCTRKRKVSDPSTAANDAQIDEGIRYIAGNGKVRDVVISGGDPLSFSDAKLESILSRLREIPHVEIIRIGTRNPVTLPQRITPQFVEMLRKYHPIFVNTHFNHPKECTMEAFNACGLLAGAGIPLGNQMVLLKGVNDSVEVVKRLNQLLLMMRVKPYYIYQCDPAFGISHFKTKIEVGLKIIEGLRGHTSGLAVPHLVIDAPGGGGKVPIQPNYILRREGNRVIIRNYQGREFVYTEPED